VKKKIILLSAVLALGAWMVLGHMTSESAWAADGKKVFMKNGCAGCHYANKGMTPSPYPSKEKMAKLPFSEFSDCITKGRPGTAMTAKSMSAGDIKAMYQWLQSFK